MKIHDELFWLEIFILSLCVWWLFVVVVNIKHNKDDLLKSIDSSKRTFFTFSFLCTVVKILFWPNFLKLDILKSPVSDSQIFNDWSVCMSVISINQKQTVARSPDLCYMGMWIETFHKDQTNCFCTGAHTITLQSMDGISCQYILTSLYCIFKLIYIFICT